MRAARLAAYGSLADIALVDLPEPVPGKGELRVRVAAASLNPLDIKLVGGGLHGYFPLGFPYIPGTDFAGTIEALGAGASGWHVGDTVIGRAAPIAGGAFASVIVVPATHVAAAPRRMALEDAAALPTAAATAWQALVETAKLQEGQRVLIHAGAGGVGSFAIQLARDAGAEVIATASAGNLALLRDLGAHQAIDYRRQDFAAGLTDVDIVLDTIGGETQQRSLAVLRPGGQLISMVAPPDEVACRARAITSAFVFHETDGGRLAEIVALCEAGKLRPVIDRKMPLTDLAAASAHVAAGHARGKVLPIAN